MPALDRKDDLWVFAYGSLMWNPGFDYAESGPATLYGYHRSLCIYSRIYRGTPARPGPGARSRPWRRLSRPGVPGARTSGGQG